MSNTGHATLSPSGRSRWGKCPASVREEARYPDESGPAAIDGTHTHTLVEHCVKTLGDPMTYLGKTLSDHEGDFVVNADRAKRAKVCIDYVKSLLGGETTIRAESRVDPAHLVGRSDMGGTVDIQVIRSDIWHLLDYKDGGGLVEVIENPQLLQYGVAMVAEAIAAGKRLPNTVRLTIVQPKLSERGLAPIQHWDVPVQRLIDEAETLKREGAATDDPNAPFVPGDVQCRYCKHRRNCQAKVEKVMSDIGVSFPVLTPFKAEDHLKSSVERMAFGLDTAQEVADKNPSEMPDDQIRAILDAAPLMRQLLESVEEEALSRLKSGKRIAGLKLVNGRGSRSWAISDEEEMASKLTKMGIPKGSVYVTKLVSPAQAEKLTWAKRDGTQVQLTPRQLERMEKEYVIKLAGKLTVAPESDSRAAVSLDASPLFAPVNGLNEGDKVLVKNVENMPDGIYTIGAPVTAAPVVPEAPALPAWLSS